MKTVSGRGGGRGVWNGQEWFAGMVDLRRDDNNNNNNNNEGDQAHRGLARSITLRLHEV